jgi:uncharacterized protein YdgA (DUF945 family)
MLLGTYDFKKVSLIVGTRQIKGFEEGTSIEADRDEDSFTKKVGVDGETTRSRSNNSAGSVTFSLNQFSEDNVYLQTLANLDERTGAGVVPVKIVDSSNPDEEIIIATAAWVKKPAKKGFGGESGPREWVLDTADINYANAL